MLKGSAGRATVESGGLDRLGQLAKAGTRGTAGFRRNGTESATLIRIQKDDEYFMRHDRR